MIRFQSFDFCSSFGFGELWVDRGYLLFNTLRALSFEGLPSSWVFCLETGRIGLMDSLPVFLAVGNDSESLRRTCDCGGRMAVCFGGGIGLTFVFAGDCNTP